MRKVQIESVPNEKHRMGVNSIRRYVGDELKTENLAFVYYELGPGEQFSGGLHTHTQQEEVFYILEGTATFEYTLEAEQVSISAGEVIRFPPGEFQCGRNESDERLVGIALGAPEKSHSDVKYVTDCSECRQETIHQSFTREYLEDDNYYYCTECGNEKST